MKKHFVHGGDVQAIECKLPSNLKKVNSKPIAYGEKSGHIHICTGDAEMFEDSEGNLFVVTGKDGASLQHVHQSTFNGDYSKKQSSKADHNSVNLKPNSTYKFGIHKRYNPFAQVWEKVID